MQASPNLPKFYENEFPAMPAKVAKPSTSKQTLKVVSAVPQEITKPPVIEKGEEFVTKTPTEPKKDGELELKLDFNTIHRLTEESEAAELVGKKESADKNIGESAHTVVQETVTELVVKEETNKETEELENVVVQELVAAEASQITYPNENECAVLKDPVIDQENSNEETPNLEEYCRNYSFTDEVDHGIMTPIASVPTTPHFINSTNPLDSDQFGQNLVINETEIDSQFEQQENPLSWAADILAEPTKFESLTRRTSLPQSACRPSKEVIDASPLLFVQRPRSQTIDAHMSEEDVCELSSSFVREENLSDVAEQSLDDATPHKKLIVVTIHPDNTFTISPPVIDTASSIHGSSSTFNLCFSTTALSASSADGSGAAVYETYLQNSHPLPTGGNPYGRSLYPGVLAPNAQMAAHTHGSDNQNRGHHTNFPPVSTSSNPYANSLNSGGSAGGNVQPYTVLTNPNGGEGISQAADVSANMNGPQETYHCTQCSISIVPTIENPMVFCPGCGPNTSYKYCSIACLLVDAYHHAGWCMNYPASVRIFPHNFPPNSPYLYETNPVISEDQTSGSREKFRQRAFSLYCRYGPFPKLSEAWCRSHPEWQWFNDLQYWDEVRCTGIYHIFSSGAFEPTDRGNPRADVLFVSLCLLSKLLY